MRERLRLYLFIYYKFTYISKCKVKLFDTFYDEVSIGSVLSLCTVSPSMIIG